MDDGDEADAAEDVPATETGWEAFEVPAAPDSEGEGEGEDDGADEPEPVRSLPTATRPAVFTGADLADWRKRRGLTQQAAADLLGVRQGTVSKAESRRGVASSGGVRVRQAEAQHSAHSKGIRRSFQGNRTGMRE